MRLIDADKIVYSWQIDADGEEHDGVTLESIIKKMPTIEERKPGRWIPQNHNSRAGYITTTVYYYPKCSECGYSGNYGMNFCPNCGVKMEVEHAEV